MSASSSAQEAHRLSATRARAHPRCVVCSPAHPLGLAQEFTSQPDGSVTSTFDSRPVFEGYAGLLHGGVTAALLDGAMTNCLFAHGIEALTAELTVRYRQPVSAVGKIVVRGWLIESHGRLHLLGADLRQDEHVKVTALGKFMANHE